MTNGGTIRTVRAGLTLAVALALVLSGSRAAAADSDAAALYYARGQQAMGAGDPARAANEFRSAWRAAPAPRTLLAIAIAYERAGDARSAMGYYWWYLNSGAASASEQEWLFPHIVELSTVAPRPVAKPAVVASTEAKPAEAKPAEAKPAEAKPAEAKPAEAKPAPTKPAPAPPARRVVLPPPPRSPDHDTTASGPTTSRWYGLPMVIGEGLSFLTLAVGAQNDSGGAVALGVLGCTLISPIVHASNGHGARGWAGFFMRAGGAGLGALAGGSDGAAVGYTAAFVLDALVLARDDVPVEPKLVPTLSLGAGGATLGLAGSF
jgi:cell division septation protein DedD